MAVQHQHHYMMIASLLFLLVLFQQSTARPVVDGFPAQKEGIFAPPMERPSGHNPPRAGPSDMASKVATESSRSKQKLVERYGPLFLSVLPRGGVPPSGPSGGTNEIKN